MQRCSSLFILVVLCGHQAQGEGTAILLFHSCCKSNLFYIDLSLEWPMKRAIPFCSQFPKHFCNNTATYSQAQLTVFHCIGHVWGTNVQKAGLCCRIWNRMPGRENNFLLPSAVSGFNLAHLYPTWLLLHFLYMGSLFRKLFRFHLSFCYSLYLSQCPHPAHLSIPGAWYSVCWVLLLALIP